MPSPSGSWPYPNADLANTRDAPNSTVSSTNVAGLHEAWTFKVTGAAVKGISAFGSLAATPIVENGVVYLQDLYANVYALSLVTGKLLWEYPVDSPLTVSEGPGRHNGHDDDSLQALDHQSKLTAPFTFLPGSLGGVLTNLAVAGGSAYVAVVDLPFQFKALAQVAGADVGTPANAKPTGEVEALNLATGKVEWDTKFSQMPLGGATVSNDLVFTTPYDGQLVALDRTTGAIIYQHKLPTTANSTIAIAGNTVLVPAGGPRTASGGGGNPQLVAYWVP